MLRHHVAPALGQLTRGMSEGNLPPSEVSMSRPSITSGSFVDMSGIIEELGETTFLQQLKKHSLAEFESDEAFEKARLAILKPSAIAYDSLQRLMESHLAELQEGLTTACSPTGPRFAAPGG